MKLNPDAPEMPCQLESGEHYGLTIRQELAARFMAAILASESEDHGYATQYLGTDGKPTYRKTMYPIGANGIEDYSQPLRELPVYKTAAQRRAEAAYEHADAFIAHENKGAE